MPLEWCRRYMTGIYVGDITLSPLLNAAHMPGTCD